MQPYYYITGCLVLNFYAHIIFKIGIGKLKYVETSSNIDVINFMTKALTSPLVLSGILAMGLATCFWLLALENLDLSKAYPFLALLFVFIPVGSSLILGEPLTSGKIIGGVLIIVGVLVSVKF